MCGRAAQTHGAVYAAASVLGCDGAHPSGETSDAATDHGGNSDNIRRNHDPAEKQHQHVTSGANLDWKDNYNMSPGMNTRIFCAHQDTIQLHEKTWGLVSKRGTTQSPLPLGMSLHYSSHMFNARSDTLFDKFTFSNLLQKKQTCLVAIDGFFEWKASKLKGSKKQPYYVYPKTKDSNSFLLLAGLWTSVPTGHVDPSTLDTFAIVTTDVCGSLSWLHDRMPLVIYDMELAKRWLQNPTRALLKEMEKSTWDASESLQWHAVTNKMNSTSFRDVAAIRPMKQPASVKSFFTTKSTSTTTAKKEINKPQQVKLLNSDLPTIEKKRPLTREETHSPTMRKKPKTTGSVDAKRPPDKGSMAFFFPPKSKTK